MLTLHFYRIYLTLCLAFLFSPFLAFGIDAYFVTTRRGPLHLPRRGAPDDGSEPTGESPVQRLTGTRATGLYQMGRAWIGVEQHQFLRPD